VQDSPLALLSQIDVYGALTAAVKVTTVKKCVIKTKEVIGVK